MSRRTQKNVGVIGLGIIGSRVADNLRRRGFHVFVWNRTPRPYPNFVGSPSEVADLCDFVQIFVSDDDALMEMVEQMKRSLKAHHVIMAHSTVAPHTMRAAAEVVQRRGAHFLDAPFTGSKIPAEKGELVYYVAGDDAAFRRARPVLEASGKEIIEIGEIGQATMIKVATNMVTAATVQATAEALALVHSSGISADKLAAAMRGNASNSATLSMKLPKMMAGDFEPHFSVKHMLKDVQIASRLARSHGLDFGATQAARDSLLQEANQGRGDYDFCSLSRAFFPDRAPMQPPAEPSDADEQTTLAGLEERAAEAPAEEKAGGESEKEVDERPTADEKPPSPGPEGALSGESSAVASEAEQQKTDSIPQEAKPDRETDAAANAEMEKDETGQSKEPDLPVSGDKEPEGKLTEAPTAPAETSAPPSADSEPTPSMAAEGKTDEPVPSEHEPATLEPAKLESKEPERASDEPDEAETSPPEFQLRGLPDADRAAVTEPPESPEEKEPAAARRSFFGRMFGRTGDY